MAGAGRRVWRQVGGRLLLLQMLLQQQLLLELLLLLQLLLLLLLNLKLLVLLQVLQMVLRRFLLHQNRSPLHVLAAQMIELGEEFLLAPILLRPERLPFLLQPVPNCGLLYQAQLHLRVGGLRRDAQQNDKQQSFDHEAPIRWSRPLTVVLSARVIKPVAGELRSPTAV